MLNETMEVRNMKRALFALGAIALGLLMLNGCSSAGTASHQISIVNAEVRDWTNPDDGKTYLAVAPTWKNDGPEAVRTVWLAVELEGPKGKFPADDADTDKAPFVSYSGDPVEAGSTIHPSDAEDSFAVLGIKEEVLAKTGPNPKANVSVLLASAEKSEEKPSGSEPPKP